MKRYITYAYRDHIPVSIDEVESGLACNCVCPFCKTKLVAKKGNVRIHHFAHYDASECDRAYEASLQLMAEDILTKVKKIRIPAVSIHFHSTKPYESVSASQDIILDHVNIETVFDEKIGNTVAYAKAKDGRYRKFYIEIQVNDTIDEEKKKKIRQANVSVILIDVSQYKDTVSYKQMMAILLKDSDDKRWLSNELAKKYYDLFIKAGDKKKFIHRADTLQVDHCPLNKRQYNNRSYANVLHDCKHCDYCIYINASGEMLLCSGRNMISNISDFSISLKERKAKYEEMLRQEEERKQKYLEGIRKEMQRKEKQQEEERDQYYRQLRIEQQKKQLEKKDDGYNTVKDKDFSQNEHQIYDQYDHRWIQCEVCGKIKQSTEFMSYGGSERMNRGVCLECAKTYNAETGEYEIMDH